MPDPGFQTKDLRVWRRDSPQKLLVDLSLSVAPGEVLTIMGPSGSGKSTALSALIGSLPPDFAQSGDIVVNGQSVSDLPPHLRRIGLMFQDDILFPHLSVAENLGFALKSQRGDRKARAAKIEEALAAANLAGFGPRDPASLSGGQRSRVALMRSLLADPKVLLLDEPFSRLDAELRASVRGFVLEQAKIRAIPVVLVTHDAQDARAAGGPVVSPTGVPVAL